MPTKRRTLHPLGAALVAWGLCWGPGGWAVAQLPLADPSDLWQEPILSRDLDLLPSGTTADPSAASRGPRCRLFRMPSAFAGDPVGLDADPEHPGDADEPAASGDKDGGGRVQVALGLDNPYFDFRLPGDPGGVGFYRLHSQVLLLDGPTTGLSMGLKAVTPAGLQADGLAEGATVFSPNLGWFYQVGDGAAIQGFVGKDLRASSGWSDSLERDIQYGVAVHSPLPWTDSAAGQNFQLFLEALGRYHADVDPSQRPSGNLDLLPGVHWRVGDNWWMSGGVLMPLGTSRLDTRFWQITCSWQF